MPLIANNIVVAGQKVEQENLASPVIHKSVSAHAPVSTSSNIDRSAALKKSKHDTEHGVLFVDGKEKKISKQSGYLLDMLTLDD